MRHSSSLRSDAIDPILRKAQARCASASFVVIVCTLLSTASAIGQETPAFIRVSTRVTPQVTDLRVLRQQLIDVRDIAEAVQSPVLNLDLFRDVSFRAMRERTETTTHGIVWVGTIEGHQGSTALFSIVGDELVGHISTPSGSFRILRLREGYLVQQVDPFGAIDGSDVHIPKAESSTRSDAARATAAEDGTVIDVLIAYTPSALKGFGGIRQTQAGLELAIAETSQAMRNAQINARFRLVHTVEVDYQETGDSLVDFARLREPADGFMDSLHLARDEHAADLLVLITEQMQEFCGRGTLASPNTRVTQVFALVKRSCIGGLTISHEIGHNLGAVHDWYDTATPGAYSYSHGHVSVPGRFRDIMSTSLHCQDAKVDCPRLVFYANPALNHQGHSQGVQAGTNTSCEAKNLNNPSCDADLATTFVAMVPIVANYRDSRTAIGARRLLPGEAFRSPNRQFRLTYQPDGDLVLYDDLNQSRLWSTNTLSQPGQAILQADGNFVIYDSIGVDRWSAGTAGNPGAYLAVQDDGNFVIYRQDGRPVWDRNR